MAACSHVQWPAPAMATQDGGTTMASRQQKAAHRLEGGWQRSASHTGCEYTNVYRVTDARNTSMRKSAYTQRFPRRSREKGCYYKMFSGAGFCAELLHNVCAPGSCLTRNSSPFHFDCRQDCATVCPTSKSNREPGGSVGRKRPLLVEGGQQAYVQRACTATARKHSGLDLGD